MNKQIRKQLESEILNMTHDDRYIARFYMLEIDDPNNPTLISAQQKADEKADKRMRITGKEEMPDYSADHLIRLGAKTVKINVPYVEIKRAGSRDSISHEVTEHHKQQFPEQWATFEAENYDQIHGRRQDVRIEASGQVHQSSGGSQFSPGSFSYSFNI